MIAFAVWRSEERQEWLASLPKKLNIFYLIEDNKNPGQWKRHVTVINAPLASETDIRAWAQSIGGTILGAERVSITFIGYDISGPHLDKHRRLQYFDVAIFLRRPIDGAMDEQFYLFDRLGKVNGKPKTSTELGEYAEYDCRISLEGQLPQGKS